METPSRVATLAALFGVLGALFFALGPLTIQIGLLSAFFGFRLFGIGVLCGLLALLLGPVGMWLTRAAAGRSGRGRALSGALLGLALVAFVVVTSARAGFPPAINDITTDLDDPPVFSAAARAEANRAGRDLVYPGAEFARAQRAAYPDLAPIALGQSAAEAFERAERAAAELGWQITVRDPESGALEAVAVTRTFRFEDDVVVRIRSSDGDVVVDVRSKSRDGRGDLGANAARIRAFREALQR